MSIKRVFICLIVMLIIAAVLSSSALILLEANHECVDDCCLICNQITVCFHLLRCAGIVFALIVLFRFVLVLLQKHLQEMAVSSFCLSPITLKIKLSD